MLTTQRWCHTPQLQGPGKGHHYSGYPVPIYTWDHEEYKLTKSGGIETHTKYATGGCDRFEPSTYVTTSTYTVTDDKEKPTPYVTDTKLTITTYVPVLRSTCTSAN
jgi:hypothetical protein